MSVLLGIDVANAINEKIIEELKTRKKIPNLAIIRVGEKADDISYERGAKKKMEKLGLSSKSYVYDEEISNKDFQEEFDKINNDDSVDGILLLKPLPKHIDEKLIESKINPKKDLDGICPVNMAKVYAGDESGFAPCTAEAVVEMLDYAKIDLSGKKVAVIGRSLVIGKPVSMLLMKKNATVTICHTKTREMEKVCKEAEIVIAAAGVAKMVTEDYIGESAIVIDVGINLDSEGNLCGDVDFEKVEEKTSLITPVPRGVGSVTTSVLAKHLMKATK